MISKLQQQFDRLVHSKGVARLSARRAMQRIGRLVDLAGDLSNEKGTALALTWCDELQKRRLKAAQAAELEYFRANAWATRQSIRHQSPGAVWQWDQPAVQNQILHLRRALTHDGFTQLPTLRRCQILTNLANQLDTVGRFIDAVEYWGRALAIQPRFAMALGNRGYGLEQYAQSLYDPGHRFVFLRFAHQGFEAALAPSAIYESAYAGAKELFQLKMRNIERYLGVDGMKEPLNLDNFKLGRYQVERHYRRWCLSNALYINPLNDLGAHRIAAQDVLSLPSYRTSLQEGPTLIGFFNQMKQEFASARWLLFEGIQSSGVHFSDRGVKLLNTLDYPAYGLAVEKTKTAFRIAYSLFDKIAYFINDYLKLGVPETAVNFRTIWFAKIDKRGRLLRPQFVNAENWPFRGLYWLAKDFSERGFRDVIEPDAHALSEIRNHLEHKYLKLHVMSLPRLRLSGSPPDLWDDRLAYSMLQTDFEAKTLRLLKLARAAMIYTVLGMHREERLRTKGQPPERYAPMTLPPWEDARKRRW